MKFRTSFALVLLITFMLAGCYEPKEGCLDVNATNFALDADRPCSDCCVYPTLRLDVQNRFTKDGVPLNLGYVDSVYYDIQGKPYRINKIRFYLSNVHLVRSDGSEEEVADELELEVWLPDGSDTEKVVVEDNFALVDAGRNRSFAMGTFAKNGEFQKVRFTLGIGEPVNRAVPSTLPDNHPLALQDDPMYWSGADGYIFYKIELFRDTVPTDTIPVVLEIGGSTILRTFSIDFPEPLHLDEGFNPKITLRIDYSLWLQSIDRDADEASLISTIVQNITPQSFQVVSAVQE